MSDCVATSFSTFTQPFSTFGQRIWVPAEGTNNIETMHWVQHDNSTTLRIFSWAEANAGPSSVTRALAASGFTTATVDCTGGTNNENWWNSVTAAGIFGFRHRTAVAPGANGGPGVLAAYWNSGPVGGQTQGHVRGAVFSLAGLGLLAQPLHFNNGFCFGYPVVTANKRGDIGVSMAFGGNAGAGGTAAQGFVSLDDEFTPGIGSFEPGIITASATHNRVGGRYGDYFTIHPYEPCEKWFSATNYGLLNGTGVANVNSRYVEFGRNQSFECWQSHFNQLPQN